MAREPLNRSVTHPRGLTWGDPEHSPVPSHPGLGPRLAQRLCWRAEATAPRPPIWPATCSKRRWFHNQAGPEFSWREDDLGGHRRGKCQSWVCRMKQERNDPKDTLPARELSHRVPGPPTGHHSPWIPLSRTGVWLSGFVVIFQESSKF